jgi:multidrug efflux pump subunit AcrA (membrane-fusion protein)
VGIEVARNKMDNDDLLYQKQKNLWAEQIGTKNELELKELTAKSSRNAFNSARLRYTNLQKQINFQAKQAQKVLELAQKTNNDFSIKSDIDGKVYQLLMEEGEMVNSLSPVAIIGDHSAFLLELQVDEYDINSIKIGQKIALSMDSYKGQVFQCLVSKINPIMNERTKSFTIEARFMDPPKTLYPNLTCEANIIIQQKTKSITIPRAYLLDGNYVYLEKDKKTKVVTGLKDYQKVEILGGITTSDYIYKPKE